MVSASLLAQLCMERGIFQFLEGFDAFDEEELQSN